MFDGHFCLAGHKAINCVLFLIVWRNPVFWASLYLAQKCKRGQTQIPKGAIHYNLSCTFELKNILFLMLILTFWGFAFLFILQNHLFQCLHIRKSHEWSMDCDDVRRDCKLFWLQGVVGSTSYFQLQKPDIARDQLGLHRESGLPRGRQRQVPGPYELLDSYTSSW